MEALSPDIAKKLLTRDFANLVGRVQKGGKLTRAERAMLQSMATGTGAAPTTAASYVELAAVLGNHPPVGQHMEKAQGRPEAGRQRVA